MQCLAAYSNQVCIYPRNRPNISRALVYLVPYASIAWIDCLPEQATFNHKKESQSRKGDKVSTGGRAIFSGA